jgi:hypothetical protein
VNVGPLSKILNTKPNSDDTTRTQAWKILFESGKMAQSEKNYDQAASLYERAHAVHSQKSGGKDLITAEILMQQASLKEVIGDMSAARELQSKARTVIAEYARTQDAAKDGHQ